MNRPQYPSDALFTGWRGVLVALGFAVVFVLSALQLAVFGNQYGLINPAGGTALGIRGYYDTDAQGWSSVHELTPGGGAAQAGIAPGDQVHLADPLMRITDAPPGTRVPLLVRHAGKVHAAQLTVYRANFGFDTLLQQETAAVFCSGLCGLLLSLFVVARGWGQRPALLLAAGLLGFADQQRLPFAAIGQGWAHWLIALEIVAQAISIGCLFALVPVLYAAHVRRLSRLTVLAIGLAVLITVALNSITSLEFIYLAYLPPWLNSAASIATLVSLLIVGVWAVRGLRDASAAERNRFAVLLLAFVVVGLAQAIQIITETVGPHDGGMRRSIELIVVLLTNIVFLLVLVYAVLRHRVVDLGFVLNRTMVYGTVSALLLGSFGLIEWAIEHLLPEEWVKASAWFDAGAAVLVYLAFHRVHDAVEHRVEHLFFHHWQANEDALRRFVAAAPHFEDAPALARAFAEELERFSGGARVAFYRRSEGALDRVAGNWGEAPRHFREETLAFALLRAERRPLDLTEARTDLPGVLALPMLDHGVLSGLVLMDAKPGGALYRPDEIALLGWAAHETGLAMAALHVGLIESELRLAKAQLARLSGLIGDRLASA